MVVSMIHLMHPADARRLRARQPAAALAAQQPRRGTQQDSGPARGGWLALAAMNPLSTDWEHDALAGVRKLAGHLLAQRPTKGDGRCKFELGMPKQAPP